MDGLPCSIQLLVTVASHTPTASATAATESASTAAVTFRLGFSDADGSSAEFMAVHSGNGRLRLGIAAHLDKAETFAAACGTVHDDRSAMNRTVLGEPGFERCVIDVVTEVPNIQLLTHRHSPYRKPWSTAPGGPCYE